MLKIWELTRWPEGIGWGGGTFSSCHLESARCRASLSFFCTNELFIISAGICIEAIQDGGKGKEGIYNRGGGGISIAILAVAVVDDGDDYCGRFGVTRCGWAGEHA